jgi:hypothetical protein
VVGAPALARDRPEDDHERRSEQQGLKGYVCNVREHGYSLPYTRQVRNQFTRG